MDFTLYKYKTPNVIRKMITLEDTSQQQVSHMRENVLVMNIEEVEPIQFSVGDYGYFNKVLYQINKLPKRKRNADRSITYNLVMEAEWYDLGKTEYLFLNSANQFTDAIFPLRGTAQNFADLIIYNLNRMYPLAGWKLGFVVQTDFKDLDFNCQNCLQALQSIAELFGTEYLIEGKTINLYEKQSANGSLILEYGEENALLDLEETPVDSSNIITRLYPYGSTKNITSSYRGGAQRLMIDGYIERNVDKFNVNEYAVVFDGTNGLPEIYPHRTGKITAVDDPFNFYDTGIDFDLNLLKIPGVSIKVVFNTGRLSGYTFEVAEGGYNNTTKKVTILKNAAEKAIDVPSVAFAPAVGDEYVFVDMIMPQPYIDKAERDLKAAAVDWLSKNGLPQVSYSGTCNPLYFKSKNIQLELCELARVLDTGLGIDKTIRVTGYTRNMNNPYLYTVELSEKITPKSFIVQLLNGI